MFQFPYLKSLVKRNDQYKSLFHKTLLWENEQQQQSLNKLKIEEKLENQNEGKLLHWKKVVKSRFECEIEVKEKTEESIIIKEVSPLFFKILTDFLKHQENINNFKKNIILFDENNVQQWLKYLGMDQLLSQLQFTNQIPNMIDGKNVIVGYATMRGDVIFDNCSKSFNSHIDMFGHDKTDVTMLKTAGGAYITDNIDNENILLHLDGKVVMVDGKKVFACSNFPLYFRLIPLTNIIEKDGLYFKDLNVWDERK